MLLKGPAKKVTIYINEDTRHHLGTLYDSILTFLLHKKVSGATATRAMEGFGAHNVLHTASTELLAAHFPMKIEFVETPEKVDELLPTLYDLVNDGLIEVQDTTVVKQARADQKIAPDAAQHDKTQGPAKLMRVFLGESDRFHGEPLYDAIVKKLRMLGIAGVTVYRGIYGYGAKGHVHKESFWHISADLPIMISAVDVPGKIIEATAAVEAMLGDGLIVVSDVEMTRLVRSHPTGEATHAPSHSS